MLVIPKFRAVQYSTVQISTVQNSTSTLQYNDIWAVYAWYFPLDFVVKSCTTVQKKYSFSCTGLFNRTGQNTLFVDTQKKGESTISQLLKNSRLNEKCYHHKTIWSFTLYTSCNRYLYINNGKVEFLVGKSKDKFGLCAWSQLQLQHVAYESCCRSWTLIPKKLCKWKIYNI